MQTHEDLFLAFALAVVACVTLLLMFLSGGRLQVGLRRWKPFIFFHTQGRK